MPNRSPAAASNAAQTVSMETVYGACAACRNELQRLAQIVERRASSGGTAAGADDSAGSGGGFMDSLANFVSSHSSHEKTRDFEREYLALAKSCQAAAKVSEYEAVALRDSLKLVSALKVAAERERDQLEEKLEKAQQQKSAQPQPSLSTASPSSPPPPPPQTSQQQQQQHQQSLASPSSPPTCSPTDAQTKSQHSKPPELKDVFTMTDDLSDTASPLDEDRICTECAELRAQLQQQEESATNREESLRLEISSLTKQLVQAHKDWRQKLAKALELEATKSAAQVRRSAASFLSRSSAAEAASSCKLLEAQLQSLETRRKLNDGQIELARVKADAEHAARTAAAHINRVEADNQALHRVIHKIATAGSADDHSAMPWSHSDESIVGEGDAQGAFHAWLTQTAQGQTPPRGSGNDPLHMETDFPVDSHYAQDDAKPSGSSSSTGDGDGEKAGASSSSSSSGIMEAARRLLSSKLATNGHVSVEDETIARALHHTNETLRDMIEENMRLQLRIRELEDARKKS